MLFTTEREWAIAMAIQEDNIEELNPPLNEEEREFFEREKASYDRCQAMAEPGVHIYYVPVNE